MKAAQAHSLYLKKRCFFEVKTSSTYYLQFTLCLTLAEAGRYCGQPNCHLINFKYM